MGFFNLFKKKSINEENEEDIHKKRRKLMEQADSFTNGISFKDVQELARRQPNNPIFQGKIKNIEEFQWRKKVSTLTALMYDNDKGIPELAKEIIECVDKGIKTNPDSVYLLYMRGRSKGDIGLFDEGLKDLNKAIKLKPDYADAYVERGYIKQKMGNFSGAKNDYDKGVELDLSLQQQVDFYLDNKN